MTKPTVRISDAEWEVMTVAWAKAPVAAAAVQEDLMLRKGWTLATVRTLLTRLVGKGVLEQRPDGKRYLYTPAVSMDVCVRQESESFLDRVMGRTPPATLVRLVEEADLSARDIENLRKILREKEKQS
jgi:BlaI family penicillinase repressor